MRSWNRPANCLLVESRMRGEPTVHAAREVPHVDVDVDPDQHLEGDLAAIRGEPRAAHAFPERGEYPAGSSVGVHQLKARATRADEEDLVARRAVGRVVALHADAP